MRLLLGTFAILLALLLSHNAAASRPQIEALIWKASRAHHVSYATLRRKAWCESRFNPRAINRSSGASGLFQFLPSTWRTTPYRRYSIWSARYNALAAAWMHRVGRGNEWVCR